MKLPQFFRQTSNKQLNIIVGLSLIIVFLCRLGSATISYIHSADKLNKFEYSEFLINFQGGFVRRGLCGEVLYQVYQIIPYPIIPVISIISYIAFFFVLIFFIRQFYKKEYCWWIIFTPLFLGMTASIVRKDYILYTILITCLYLLRNASPSLIKRLVAFLLITFGLFLHEAFIFFGFPIYALLMLSYKRNKVLNYVLLILPFVIFLILCKFKGTPDTAISIVDSWNSLLPDAPLKYVHKNSIGAIGWDSVQTFIFHLRANAGLKEHGAGIVIIPVSIIAAYYMITNFFYVFRTNHKHDPDTDRLTLSLLYSSAIICLLPMFTILSCDVGRVFQYASLATFATFLIIPHHTILTIFPKWYSQMIERFNHALFHILKPSKVIVILILLFWGMGPFGFVIRACWGYSIIGGVFKLLNVLVQCLLHLFL